MSVRIHLFASLMLALAAPCLAQPEERSANDLGKVADAVSPSLVVVEFMPQFDKGESPSLPYQSWRRGGSDAEFAAVEDWDQLLQQQRPDERTGFVLGPDRVVTTDPLVNERFVKSITVRAGDRRIGAKVEGYARAQNAVFLRLAEPLPGVRPLTFATRSGSLLGITHARWDGQWLIGVSGLPTRVTVGLDRRYTRVSAPLLITDGEGAAVGLTFTGELDLDGAWRGDPAAWPSLDAAGYGKAIERLRASSDRSVLRVSLSFRSPKSGSGTPGRFSHFGGMGDDDGATEWHGSGILIEPSTVLVLAGLKPKVTARLEAITVHLGDGSESTAAFDGTLADFNGFLARLPASAEGTPKPWTRPITDLRHHLLLSAEVSVHGESRTAYFGRARMSEFVLGYRGMIHPAMESVIGGGWSRFGSNRGQALRFVFTTEGELVAAPIGRRPKVAEGTDDGPVSWLDARGHLTPFASVLDALRDRKAALDPENCPRSEADESRLAWLGVEMQAMDPDLARANGVSSLTAGGTTGALVSYVYPGSPAAKAGLQVGDILLRLHLAGQPRPFEVTLDDDHDSGMLDQIWKVLDQIPEEYFDQMPKPWGSVENAITRALTDVGFGTGFEAEVFRDGKVTDVPMVVEEGPPHFDSAAKFKSEAAGVTVRELTYEVRRYFQMTPEQPGVIVSKIERGEKAAVAGLKPFEIITQVGDTPMRSVADFEAALKAGGELRLSVKRMTEGRIVKLRMDPAGP
ncbi:MAG: hypothetical protein JNM80_08070 [Phycisphaerae bacterium]|nr:hypothetical protein [Phycisphaerae bacterium]